MVVTPLRTLNTRFAVRNLGDVMRMKVRYKRYFPTFLILLMFVTTMTVVPSVFLGTNQDSTKGNESILSPSPDDQDSVLEEKGTYQEINDYSFPFVES